MAVLQNVLSAAVLCLAIGQVRSQFGGGWYARNPLFGMGGGYSGYDPYRPYAGQPQQEEPLTCTNTLRTDQTSTIRLTIKADNHLGYNTRGQGVHGGHPGLGGQGVHGGHPVLGGLGGPGLQPHGVGNSETPMDWNIEGLYRPGTLMQQGLSGRFQVVVTKYGGRTAEGCHAVALGPAIQSQTPAVTPNPFLANPLLRGMGTGFGGSNNYFNNGPSYRAAGHLENPMIVTQGGVTMYAARLRGVSRSQLQGAGVALCSQVTGDGQCAGAVVQCCTIAKDQLPVSRVYVQGQNPGNNVLNPGVGVGGYPLVGFGVGDDDDDIFGVGVGGSVPFQLNSGLTFTAASSASASSKEEDSGAGSTAGLF